MFVVSNKMTEFFKHYDLMQLFNMLDDEFSFANSNDGRIEHSFERLFGYLIDYLGLKTYCLDYQPLPYPDDNCITKTCYLKNEHTVEEIRKVIKEHNLKVMALYCTDFYKKQAKAGTEDDGWTQIKKYQGEIKRPAYRLRLL